MRILVSVFRRRKRTEKEETKRYIGREREREIERRGATAITTSMLVGYTKLLSLSD